jgi:transcriptional regulator with XRE-family HTH domain
MARTFPPPPNLGRVIRALRNESGLTQEELAVRAGLHPVHISMLESGRRQPALATFDRLLLALGVTWSDVGPRVDEARHRPPDAPVAPEAQ